VFAGGWTLEAAEAVCAGEGIDAREVLDLLIRLVDKSLVLVEEPPDGSARYRLLETLRQYGQQRLATTGAGAGLFARHAAHYLEWAERACPALLGAEQLAWLDRLERDQDNLRGALRWARARPDRAWPAGRRRGVALRHVAQPRGPGG
jgi:predicted ATPase